MVVQNRIPAKVQFYLGARSRGATPRPANGTPSKQGQKRPLDSNDKNNWMESNGGKSNYRPVGFTQNQNQAPALASSFMMTDPRHMTTPFVFAMPPPGSPQPQSQPQSQSQPLPRPQNQSLSIFGGAK